MLLVLLRLTFVSTLVLIGWGGVVHNTESSLACPDWPTCFGSLTPVMEGAVLIEHGHRLLASWVGLLCVIMWATSLIQKVNRHYFSALLGMVLFQGLLGGITVLYQLPTIVSTLHLTTAMGFLILLVYGLNFSQHQKSMDELKAMELSQYSPGIKNNLLLLSCLVYLQIILGAFMRHSGAGAACGMGADNAILCLDPSAWSRTWLPHAPAALLHMFHRFFALVVSGFLLHFVYRVWSESKRLPLSLSIIPLALVLLQIVLGYLTISLHFQVIPTTLHLIVAALLLAHLMNAHFLMRRAELSTFGYVRPSLLSDLVDMTKPRLASLVMGSFLIGMLVSKESIPFFTGLLIFVATWAVVGGACALNCVMEKNTDAQMERTKNRPIPTGRISPKQGTLYGVILGATGLVLLLVFAPVVTFILGLLSFILYLYAYTPLKTVSSWSLVVGAIPGAIPPLMGESAASGNLSTIGLFLFSLVFIWQFPHFLSIALYHQRDFAGAGIKTLFNQKGFLRTKIEIFLFSAVLLFLVLIPYLFKLRGLPYAYSAIALSFSFLLISTRGFVTDHQTAAIYPWARTLFLGSIIYLPLVMLALLMLN